MIADGNGGETLWTRLLHPRTEKAAKFRLMRGCGVKGDFVPHNTVVKGKIFRPKLDVIRISLGSFGPALWEAEQIIAKIGTFPAGL